MSGPELLHKISSLEEAPVCLRRITKICLDLKDINQRNIKIVDNLRELHLGLNKPTSKNTVASSDMAPDPSSGLDSVGVIAQGFCGPFLLNISWRDFEKVDEGRTLSSQLWVRMARYRSYIK